MEKNTKKDRRHTKKERCLDCRIMLKKKKKIYVDDLFFV